MGEWDPEIMRLTLPVPIGDFKRSLELLFYSSIIDFKA